MAINLETQVSSSYDKDRRVHTYSIERDGQKHSVEITDAEFDACAPMGGAQAAGSKQRRRELLARRLKAAMDA